MTFVYRLPIDFSPMADTQDEHQKTFVNNLADQTVVPDPVFPKFTEFRAWKRLTYSWGIFGSRHPIVEEFQDSASVLRVEFVEFARRALGDFNGPSHGALEPLLEGWLAPRRFGYAPTGLPPDKGPQDPQDARELLLSRRKSLSARFAAPVSPDVFRLSPEGELPTCATSLYKYSRMTRFNRGLF